MKLKLSNYKALTFDVYGALINWESGMVAGLKPLTDKVSRSQCHLKINSDTKFFKGFRVLGIPSPFH